MATQWTAGLSIGEVLTAGTMNTIGAVWESWTPVWTGSTTNPVIGNGTLTGRYCQFQKLIIAEGIILAGSTTTYGTGTYRVSLPIGPAFNSNGAMGYATFFDASAGYVAYTGLATLFTTSLMEFRVGNGLGQFQPTVPVTMANADQFRFTYVYQAA